jgi:hypothetical protein
MADAKTTLNLTQNFDFETYYKLIGKAPIGLRLYLAQQLLDNAASRIGRSQKELRASIEECADEIAEIRNARKKAYEAQENQGRPEMELPQKSTSADAGKVS